MTQMGEAQDARSVEERARNLLARDSAWLSVHSQFNPTLNTRNGEIFRADGFDEEYWGVNAPGAVLELWFSERGERRRIFRTGDPDAFVAKVLLDGLARQGKRLWKACEFDERPAGFLFEALSDGRGVVVEWGEDSWAEFLGAFQLSRALKFCHFLNASSDDISAAVDSRDGATLLQRSSRSVPCGPQHDRNGEITIALWERWLREKRRT